MNFLYFLRLWTLDNYAWLASHSLTRFSIYLLTNSALGDEIKTNRIESEVGKLFTLKELSKLVRKSIWKIIYQFQVFWSHDCRIWIEFFFACGLQPSLVFHKAIPFGMNNLLLSIVSLSRKIWDLIKHFSFCNCLPSPTVQFSALQGWNQYISHKKAVTRRFWVV